MTRIFMVLAIMAIFPRTALAEDYATPRELLQELDHLQSAPCDINCQIKIANMYSKHFLESQRHAVMLGLENEEYRKKNVMLFFGEEIPIEDLKAMSSEEFLARQLWYRERTTPSDMILKKLEIISERQISKTEIKMVVVRSGLKADPKYKEEGFMTFIKEGGTWKIKH